MPEGLSQEQSVELERLHGLVESGTYYELLSVAPNAPSKEIQKAYYGLTRVWHPDRFFRIELGDSSEKLQSVFAAITQGYRTLT
ncbi:MAG: J domain-containing protein, partial [Myxococcota bacterium]|nr:J domain-containing protein [Myxococcota bacterium]